MEGFKLNYSWLIISSISFLLRSAAIHTVKILIQSHVKIPSKFDAQSDLKLEGVDCNSPPVPSAVTTTVCSSWLENRNHVLQICYPFGFRC